MKHHQLAASNILTVSNSNVETNSTLSEDPIESLQNDAVCNSSLRSANNEDGWKSHIKYTLWKSWRF